MNSVTHYDDLRAAVRDGDTVAPLATGVYGGALALANMGPYGHVGIVRTVVVEGVDRLMVVEENPGGGRYTPLSHYRGVTLDVFRPPDGIDGRRASAHAVAMLDGLAHYDWGDIARMVKWGAVRALARLFDDHQPLPPEAEVCAGTKGVICSALVSAAYERAGWRAPAATPWPSALCELLGSPAVRYRP